MLRAQRFEIALHELRLALAHQPGIDVNAADPVGPSARRHRVICHRRIDAAADEEKYIAVAAHVRISSSIAERGVRGSQSVSQPQMSNTKLDRISRPRVVCTTSG